MVIWCDRGGMAAIAGPVWSGLRVATVTVAVGTHVLCLDGGVWRGRVGILRGAGPGNARVYGNITVRFHL